MSQKTVAQAAAVPDLSLSAVAAGVPALGALSVPAGGLYAGVVAGHHVYLQSGFTVGSWEDCAQFASDAGGSLPAFDEMVVLRSMGVAYPGPHWAADRANGDRALAYSFLSGLSGYSHTSQVFNGLVVRREAAADAVSASAPVAAGVLPAVAEARYCYSYDGEAYSGDFYSALAAAAEVFSGDPGRDTVHVGESVFAATSNYVSADSIIDGIAQRAYDEVGEFAEDWLHGLSKNAVAKAELEQLVAEFIDRHEPPTFWTVANVRQVTLGEVVAAGLIDQQTEGALA